MKVHKRFCTKTRFEAEAKANSEVVRSLMQNTWTLSYFYIFNSVILGVVCNRFKLDLLV